MATSETLPDDAGKLPRHMRAGAYGYGWLLALILLSIAFQLAAPDTDPARVVTIFLVGGTLIASLWVSGMQRWLIHTATLITVIAVAGATGVLIGSGELDDGAGRLLALMFVVLAPTAIVVGMVRHARRFGRTTVRTMFGVLCIYLLVGSAFAFAYGLISAAGSTSFFAHVAEANQSDFLYFSFVTLTTTGFGDLTAATDLGRSLAITEALIGQIYLVTVVALIVTNIGAGRFQHPGSP
jgi:voltage-gated potassium channel Kch